MYSKPNLNGDLFSQPDLFNAGITVSPTVTSGGTIDLRVGSDRFPLRVKNMEELQRKLQEKYTGSMVTQATLHAISQDATTALMQGTAHYDISTSASPLTITASTSGVFDSFSYYVPTMTATTGTVHFYTDATGNLLNMPASTQQLKAFLFKQKMKSNLQIIVKRRSHSLGRNVSPAEEIARNSLRDQLSEAEFRRYLTNGFIMVKGVSGRFYQLFNNSNLRVQVYFNNKKTHSICIHTDSSCPPTDHVLNLKTLIEIDESLIWKAGNVAALNSLSAGALALAC